MELVGPPVLKNQPTQIFDTGFCDYSQNSTNIYNVNVVLIFIILANTFKL